MILARYLSNKILFTTLAVATVLTLVVMSSRMARYISAAAEGQLAVGLVFPVVFFHMPQLLELILPVSLLLGTMLAYGDLYESNEMTVVQMTGVSQSRILLIGMLAATFVAVVVALFSFYVSPKGSQYVKELVNAQGLKSELSELPPGTFFQLKNRGGTLYAGEVEEGRSAMRKVFVHRPGAASSSAINRDSEQGTPDENKVRETLVFADRGYQEYRDGGFYFVLEDGVQFEGYPGERDYVVTRFEKYSQRIERPDNSASAVTDKHEAMVITQIMADSSHEALAELHWRVSLPIAVLMLGALGVLLSRTKPRQGRYYLLVPALIIYLAYMFLLNAGRDAIAEDGIQHLSRIWGVHTGMVLLLVAIAAKGSLANGLSRVFSANS